MEETKQWSDLYGDFQFDREYNDLTIANLDKESGWIRGEIVHAVRSLPSPKGKILLPGEHNGLKETYAQFLKVAPSKIVTTGVSEKVDHHWNFENEPPFKGTFSLIISQAMLEHLLDPYKHMKDLFNFLEPGGHLVMHTVIPGFPYHRHPIDCMRFYPDWFEEVASRHPVRVVWKFIGEQRILYAYRKEERKSDRKWWQRSRG